MLLCPFCGKELKLNKGWAGEIYEGYCNQCDKPIEDGIEFPDNTNWNIALSFEEYNNQFIAEFDQYSNAGEDFSFNVYYNGTTEDLIEQIKDYYYSFEPQEHAKMWIENMDKVKGVPQDIQELLDDANDIKEMIWQLIEDYEKEYKDEDDIDEEQKLEDERIIKANQRLSYIIKSNGGLTERQIKVIKELIDAGYIEANDDDYSLVIHN